MKALRCWLARALAAALLLALPFVEGSGIAAEARFDYALSPIVSHKVYNLLDWEIVTILGKLRGQIPLAKVAPGQEHISRYFELLDHIHQLQAELRRMRGQGLTAEAAEMKHAEAELSQLQEEARKLENAAEAGLEAQIREALLSQGFSLSLGGHQFPFPPVSFEFERSPLLLVISPRERIAIKRQICLESGLSLREMEELEAQVEALEVSALIIPIGGLSTYPAMILENTSLEFNLGAIAHEWFHAYFFLKPLGQHYSDSQDTITMNETAATIAGDEIGRLAQERYWPETLRSQEEKDSAVSKEEADFNREMRNTRLAVEEMLSRGEVEAAERLMEEKRQLLVAKGHHLRKLNQAYFAFYGSYATGPLSIDPIGAEMTELRRKAKSLREFVERVAYMVSRDDLRRALE